MRESSVWDHFEYTPESIKRKCLMSSGSRREFEPKVETKRNPKTHLNCRNKKILRGRNAQKQYQS